MVGQKRRIHLRKEVYIIIPIAFLVATLVTLLMINSNKMQSYEVTPVDVAKSNNIEEIQSFKLKDDLLKSYNDYVYVRQRDNTIRYYASKYKIDADKAIEIAHELTDNYKSADYLETHKIGNDFVKEKAGNIISEEAGLIYFVKDLFTWPQRYGYEIEDIRLSEEVSTERNIVDGNIMIDNMYTYEQYVAKISTAFGLEPKIVLAITYLETGYLKSGLFINNNNVGGMKGYQGWMQFTTLESGIISHVLAVKNIVEKYDIDMTSEDAIAEFSSIYDYGYPGVPSPHWTEKVTTIYNNIKDEDLLF